MSPAPRVINCNLIQNMVVNMLCVWPEMPNPATVTRSPMLSSRIVSFISIVNVFSYGKHFKGFNTLRSDSSDWFSGSWPTIKTVQTWASLRWSVTRIVIGTMACVGKRLWSSLAAVLVSRVTCLKLPFLTSTRVWIKAKVFDSIFIVYVITNCFRRAKKSRARLWFPP